MNEKEKETINQKSTDFSRKVGEKADRKLKAQTNPSGVWFGLGMMGLIGWSVAIPTLLGVALGIWLDTNYSSPKYSWTLSLLIIGLFIGCLNAWHWVSKQHKDMNDE